MAEATLCDPWGWAVRGHTAHTCFSWGRPVLRDHVKDAWQPSRCSTPAVPAATTTWPQPKEKPKPKLPTRAPPKSRAPETVRGWNEGCCFKATQRQQWCNNNRNTGDSYQRLQTYIWASFLPKEHLLICSPEGRTRPPKFQEVLTIQYANSHLTYVSTILPSLVIHPPPQT